MKSWMKVTYTQGHVVEVVAQVGEPKGKGKGKGKHDPAVWTAKGDDIRDVEVSMETGRMGVTMLQGGELAQAALIVPNNRIGYIETSQHVEDVASANQATLAALPAKAPPLVPSTASATANQATLAALPAKAPPKA